MIPGCLSTVLSKNNCSENTCKMSSTKNHTALHQRLEKKVLISKLTDNYFYALISLPILRKCLKNNPTDL